MPAAFAMAGGSLHHPPTGGSSTSSAPVAGSGRYAVVKRPCFSAGTLNDVSAMPSGSNSRARRKASSGCPLARSSRTPSTCAPVL